MDQKERSDYIIEWINSHPLINTAMLCRMAGGIDTGNFSNAMVGNRLIPEKYLDAVERVLADYGFKKHN